MRPSEIAANYVNRKFEVGTGDCFHILREAADDYFSLKIPAFYGAGDFSQYTRKESINLIDKALVLVPGMEKRSNLSELRPFDVVVLSLGDNESIHLAGYLGHDRVFHVPGKGTSVVDVYSDKMKEDTLFFLRFNTPDIYSMWVEQYGEVEPPLDGE